MTLDDSMRMYAEGSIAGAGYAYGHVQVSAFPSVWETHELASLVLGLKIGPRFRHLALSGEDVFEWAHLDHFLEWRKSNAPDVELTLETCLGVDTKDIEYVKEYLPGLAIRVRIDSIMADTNIKGIGREISTELIPDNLEALDSVPMITVHTQLRLGEKFLQEVVEVNEWMRKARGMRFRHVITPLLSSEWALLPVRMTPKDLEDAVRGMGLANATLHVPRLPRNDVRCWMGRCGFYANADRQVFPCRQVAAFDERKIGDLHVQAVQSIGASCQPALWYADMASPCRWSCMSWNACHNEAASERVQYANTPPL